MAGQGLSWRLTPPMGLINPVARHPCDSRSHYKTISPCHPRSVSLDLSCTFLHQEKDKHHLLISAPLPRSGAQDTTMAELFSYMPQRLRERIRVSYGPSRLHCIPSNRDGGHASTCHEGFVRTGARTPELLWRLLPKPGDVVMPWCLRAMWFIASVPSPVAGSKSMRTLSPVNNYAGQIGRQNNSRPGHMFVGACSVQLGWATHHQT